MLYILYIVIVISLVSADQFSKFLVVEHIDKAENIVIIKDFFSLTNVSNYGAGFSIMQNKTFFLIAITLIAIVAVIYLLIKSKKEELLNRISYLLIISGAIGNLIDRIKLNYVIDFLDFNFFGYNFPVFNLADCFITIGCALLLISILKENKRAKH